MTILTAIRSPCERLQVPSQFSQKPLLNSAIVLVSWSVTAAKRCMSVVSRRTLYCAVSINSLYRFEYLWSGELQPVVTSRSYGRRAGAVVQKNTVKISPSPISFPDLRRQILHFELREHFPKTPAPSSFAKWAKRTLSKGYASPHVVVNSLKTRGVTCVTERRSAREVSFRASVLRASRVDTFKGELR